MKKLLKIYLLQFLNFTSTKIKYQIIMNLNPKKIEIFNYKIKI